MKRIVPVFLFSLLSLFLFTTARQVGIQHTIQVTASQCYSAVTSKLAQRKRRERPSPGGSGSDNLSARPFSPTARININTYEARAEADKHNMNSVNPVRVRTCVSRRVTRIVRLSFVFFKSSISLFSSVQGTHRGPLFKKIPNNSKAGHAQDSAWQQFCVLTRNALRLR